MRNRAIRIILVLSAASLLVAGVAVAVVGIPDGDGVIHACYDNRTGLTRLVVSETQCSASRETGIHWNQTGPTGPAGPAGVAGGPTRIILPIYAGDQDGNLVSSCPGQPTGPGWFTLLGCPANVPGSEFLTLFNFDPADYPEGAEIVFFATILVEADREYCVRLYDATAGEPIPNSTMCPLQPSRSFFKLGLGGVDFSGSSGSSAIVVQQNQVDGLGSGELWEAHLDISW